MAKEIPAEIKILLTDKEARVSEHNPNGELALHPKFFAMELLAVDEELSTEDRIELLKAIWEALESRIGMYRRHIEFCNTKVNVYKEHYLNLSSKRRTEENYKGMKEMLSSDLGISEEQLLALLQQKLGALKNG